MLGQSFGQNKGLGRLWSPMVEFLATRDLATGAATNWDVLPQLQITISKRQHIRADAGVRIPTTNTAGTADPGSVLYFVGLAGRQADGRLVMEKGVRSFAASMAAALLVLSPQSAPSAERHKGLTPKFQTSDRCIACHNGLTTPSGEDVSIGFEWRASIMANSSRDPYWQASVRRESIDHPESQAAIEDECSVCHMPITRYEAKLRGHTGEVFSHLPFDPDKKEGREAEDGVSCSVCHQIAKDKLGTRESFNGGFVIDGAGKKRRASGVRPVRYSERESAHYANVHRRLSPHR